MEREPVNLESLTYEEALAKLRRIRDEIAKDFLSVNVSVDFDPNYAQDVLSEEFGIEQGWDG